MPDPAVGAAERLERLAKMLTRAGLFIEDAPEVVAEFRRDVAALMADRDALQERAALALAGIPDPMHPDIPMRWKDQLTAAQIVLMAMAGDDDPGDVEAATKKLAALGESAGESK